jgi:hypothetical protein
MGHAWTAEMMAMTCSPVGGRDGGQILYDQAAIVSRIELNGQFEARSNSRWLYLSSISVTEMVEWTVLAVTDRDQHLPWLVISLHAPAPCTHECMNA